MAEALGLVLCAAVVGHGFDDVFIIPFVSLWVFRLFGIAVMARVIGWWLFVYVSWNWKSRYPFQRQLVYSCCGVVMSH
jgi:hypothetical protein